jgi:hypothetical protein
VLEIGILADDRSRCEVLLKMGYKFPSIRAIPGPYGSKVRILQLSQANLGRNIRQTELPLGRYATDDALRVIAWADEMPITEPLRHMADEQTPFFQFRG